MSAFLQVGDVRLHYVQRGSGDDVVLLAGLGDAHDAWDAQIEAFSARFRVTAIDNRGVGQSSLPDGEFTVADMARDAGGALDALGIVSAHVAGFSMGGAIAQELALARPDLVRSLLLNGTWCKSDAFLIATLRSICWQATVADDARSFFESFLCWCYSPAVFADGRIEQFIVAGLEHPHPQDGEAFLRTARAIESHDTESRLGAIAAPTLIVVGGEDILCPPRHSHALAAGIPGSRLIEIPEQAHQPFQEDPAGFNRHALSFWDAL
jgi:3-oxoadipate enol-lactonase